MVDASCDKVRELLFDYLDDELSESEKQTVTTHLEECENCRKELETRRELLKLIKESAYTPKSDLAAAFLGSVELSKEKPKRRFEIGRLVKYGSIAAAFLLMVTAAIGFGMFGGDKVTGAMADAEAAQDVNETVAETLPAVLSFTEDDSDAAAPTVEEGNAESAGSSDGAAAAAGAENSPILYSVSPTAELYGDAEMNDSVDEAPAEASEASEAEDNNNLKFKMRPPRVSIASLLLECAPEHCETTTELFMVTSLPEELDPDMTADAIAYECTNGTIYIYEERADWEKVADDLLEGCEYVTYTEEREDQTDRSTALLVRDDAKVK